MLQSNAMRRGLPLLLGAWLLLLSSGCGGQGSLTLTVWGEEFIEDAIPANEVEDGWKLTFEKFLIVIGGVDIAAKDGTKGRTLSESRLFDLRQKGPHPLGEAVSLASGTWDALTYRVLPANASTTVGNASEADLKMMAAQGYSIYFEGKATKGGTTKSFAWGFKTATTYQNCLPQKPALQAGGTSTFQLTIHADHFFYDDLESPDAKVRFDAIAAADADNDGKITLAELQAVGGATFAGLAQYGVGRFSDVKDLQAFVTQLSKTLGHIDGEGHCDIGSP